MLPLNEQAYQHLQKLILSNRLSYGQIYSETRLSRELGISRTPLGTQCSTMRIPLFPNTTTFSNQAQGKFDDFREKLITKRRSRLNRLHMSQESQPLFVHWPQPAAKKSLRRLFSL